MGWAHLLSSHPEREPLPGGIPWDDLATLRLYWLVPERKAVHWLEAEATLAEGDRHAGEPQPRINPHHISVGRTRLVTASLLLAETAATRGQRAVKVLTPADQRGRATVIARTAARKRLLAARYLGWATGGTTYPHGVIGPTGERVVRRSLVQAGSMRLLSPGAGEVSRFLGVSLPDPLDSGGLLTTGHLDDPGPTVAVAIEVKSVRDWIYPTSKELFQLLDKAARLREARPDYLILPVLVCRRAHFTTFKMAKQLGFFVIETHLQYLSTAAATPEQLREVRVELGLEDLRWEPAGADATLVRRFRTVLPPRAAEHARAWASTAARPELRQFFGVLRRQHPPPVRAAYMAGLRDTVRALGPHDGC